MPLNRQKRNNHVPWVVEHKFIYSKEADLKQPFEVLISGGALITIGGAFYRTGAAMIGERLGPFRAHFIY